MTVPQSTIHGSVEPDARRDPYRTFYMRYMARYASLMRLLDKALRDTSAMAHDVAPGAVLQGRVKSLSSAWMKASRLHNASLVDSVGVRVIVASTADCYRVLKRAHREFETVPGADDDYILHPKPNGYRSLHTTLVLPRGHAVELQIRTASMHAAAETGIASHRRYKAITSLRARGKAHPSAPPSF
jgi:GTP pyrophosphokinase